MFNILYNYENNDLVTFKLIAVLLYKRLMVRNPFREHKYDDWRN